MNLPKVSVIIPNYNYRSYLPEALDSVLGQTYQNIEVVVVDDGSTDGSKEVIDGYGGHVIGLFQSNQGVSAARNNGVAASSGELIAFLDADDLWLPEKIEAQVERLIADPGLGLVHVAVDEVDAEGRLIGQKMENALDGPRTGDFFLLTKECVFGGGSGILIPRKVFDEVGGFDTQMSTSADWDLFCRVTARYPVGFVPRPLLKYRIHSSNMHANVAVMERDMMRAFDKAFGPGSEEILAVKQKAYGNLHFTLAGSYFRAGEYKEFVRHAAASISNYPRNILRFLRVPT